MFTGLARLVAKNISPLEQSQSHVDMHIEVEGNDPEVEKSKWTNFTKAFKFLSRFQALLFWLLSYEKQT